MCCEKQFRPLRLINAFITFLVLAFDLGVSWYAFSQIIPYRDADLDSKLNIGAGVACGVATLLFCFALGNTIQAYRLYTSSSDDISSPERSLDRWEEIVSFFQLVLHDCAMTVIVFIVYQLGTCPMFLQLFEKTFAGNLVVIAALVSTIWKVAMALCLCCCGCCKGVSDCGWDCLCCCCRAFRSTVALLLMAFCAYLLFVFNGKGLGVRTSC